MKFLASSSFKRLCLCLLTSLFLCHDALGLQQPVEREVPPKLASTTGNTARFNEQSLPRSSSCMAAVVPAVKQQRKADTDQEPAIWKLAMLGAIASLISDVAMHPTDCVKTLQQSDEGMGLSMTAAAFTILEKRHGLRSCTAAFCLMQHTMPLMEPSNLAVTIFSRGRSAGMYFLLRLRH